MARRTKYSPKRVELVLDALRHGNTRTAAAAAAGIARGQLYSWMERFPTFRDDVEKAEADAELAMVSKITTAAVESWTAAAWWLERRRPNDWGRVDRVEITLRQEAERLASQLGLDPAELVAEAERIVAEAV